MTKNEFMVCMHDAVLKERFLDKLYNDNMISLRSYQKVLFEMIADSDKIRTGYFSDDNSEREVLSKEEMNYIFGRK